MQRAIRTKPSKRSIEASRGRPAAARRLGWALAVIGALTVPHLHAQEGSFGDVIDVRVIEVEVVVTDENGNRVGGLSRDDFVLRVSGEELPIDYFDEWRDGLAVPPPGAAAGDSSKLVPGVPSGPGPAARTAEGNRYLVFLDDYYTTRRHRGAVIDRLLDDLDSLSRRDRMAVVRFRGKGVEVLSHWTGSKQELRRVLEEARATPSWELRRKAELDRAANPTNRIRIRASQIEEVTDAVAASLHAFSDAPGRKLLVLASAGWPYDLPTNALDPSARSESNRLGGQQLLRPVTETANLLGYTVYPFHVGVHSGGPTAADRQTNEDGVPVFDETDGEVAAAGDTVNNSSEEPGTDTTDVPSIANVGPLGSLAFVADQTGGRLYAYSPARSGLFDSVVEDARTYYSLGFSAPMAGDGGTRSIEVEVRGEGLKVRHRRGYRDFTRQERADQRAEATLLTGAVLGLPLEATLGEPKGRRRIDLPVTLRIPMDWVTMVEQKDGVYAADLELRVTALDDDGDRSELATIPIELRGPRPPPGSHAVYETSVKLRRERHRLVLTLRDPPTEETLIFATLIEP